MKVYMVTKEAVYRHGCGGIFTTRDAAIRAANKLRDGEKDSHHSYSVTPITIDKRTPQGPLVQETNSYSGRKYLSGGELLDPVSVYDSGLKGGING